MNHYSSDLGLYYLKSEPYIVSSRVSLSPGKTWNFQFLPKYFSPQSLQKVTPPHRQLFFPYTGNDRFFWTDECIREYETIFRWLTVTKHILAEKMGPWGAYIMRNIRIMLIKIFLDQNSESPQLKSKLSYSSPKPLSPQAFQKVSSPLRQNHM